MIVGLEDLGVCRGGYGQVHPGVRCPVDLQCIRSHLLRLDQEEVTLLRPGAQPKSSQLPLVRDEVNQARCERVVMARFEAPLGATNVLIKPSQKSSRNSVFIARMLVRARPKVPVCIMNVINQDQVLSEGTTIGHGEPAVWATVIDDQKREP